MALFLNKLQLLFTCWFSRCKWRFIQSIMPHVFSGMKHASVALLILLSFLILTEVCQGRGRGGGGRGGGRSGSRGSRSSRSRSSGGGSYSKPRITKSTPITPKSRKTAVIKKQAPIGYRSSTARNVLVGYVVYRYTFTNARVYSREYQMYGKRTVRIPEERAARIMSTETRMLDLDNNLCLPRNFTAQKRELPSNVHVVGENATIQYNNEKAVPFDGINKNFTLREKEGVDFNIVTRTEYNDTLVAGRDCFVVEERVNGTVVRMYATNPNGASAVVASGGLSLLALFLALIWPATTHV